MFPSTLLKKSNIPARCFKKFYSSLNSCKRLLLTNNGVSFHFIRKPIHSTTTTAYAIILSSFLVLGSGFLDYTSKQTQLESTTAVASTGDRSVDTASTNSSSAQVDHNDDGSTTTTTLLNWSGTHAVTVSNQHYYEPESIEEVESIVRHCHRIGQPLRPLGSALSPNGIAFSSEGMISMANLDQIVEVDPERMTVTVQAGARVSQVRCLKKKKFVSVVGC